MLTIKTTEYSFLETDPHAEAFVRYMRDKYEWGGAEVYVGTDDGLRKVSITTIHEVDENDLKDFMK